MSEHETETECGCEDGMVGCGVCAGSGEGMYDGSRCPVCKGQGMVPCGDCQPAEADCDDRTYDDSEDDPREDR